MCWNHYNILIICSCENMMVIENSFNTISSLGIIVVTSYLTRKAVASYQSKKFWNWNINTYTDFSRTELNVKFLFSYFVVIVMGKEQRK